MPSPKSAGVLWIVGTLQLDPWRQRAAVVRGAGAEVHTLVGEEALEADLGKLAVQLVVPFTSGLLESIQGAEEAAKTCDGVGEREPAGDFE